MKKTIALILTLCTLICTLSACHSRRDKYTPNDTETDTLAGGETAPEEGGGVLAEYAYGTNPYAGMSQQELIDLFRENYRPNEQTKMNTPFYYILEEYNGALAYSKLTGEFVHLCKDPLCNHETCVFHRDCFIKAHTMSDDRIYLLVRNNSWETVSKYLLYSFNYSFDDARLEYSWLESDTPEYIYYDASEGGRIFYCANYRENQVTTKQVFVLDLKTQKVSLLDWPYAPKDGEKFYFYSVQNGMLYYQTYREDAIHRYDLTTKEDCCVVHTSILRPEDGELSVDFSRADADGKHIYIDIFNRNSGKISMETWRFNIDTGERIIKYKTTSMCGGFGVFSVDHRTEAFKDDPFYEYYVYDPKKDTAIGSRSNKFGGELWLLSPESGKEERCLYVSTDGIPENFLSWNSDGKCLFIRYVNYMDYPNEYSIGRDPFTDPYLTGGYMIVDPLTQVVRGAGSENDIVWYPDRAN